MFELAIGLVRKHDVPTDRGQVPIAGRGHKGGGPGVINDVKKWRLR